MKFTQIDQQINNSVQFSSVTQSCPTLWDTMNRSTPGLPVPHQLPEFTQTHVHRVSDAIQPSHPLSSPSPPPPNPSQHQSLFQWVNSSHDVAKVLEFQLGFRTEQVMGFFSDPFQLFIKSIFFNLFYQCSLAIHNVVFLNTLNVWNMCFPSY